MLQWVKEFTAKAGDLTSMSRIYIVEGERTVSFLDLKVISPYMYMALSAHTYAHAHIHFLNIKISDNDRQREVFMYVYTHA